MFVNATIVARHQDVWTLPVTAVVAQGERNFCFRIENGKARRTPLRVGLVGDQTVEILALQNGAQVTGAERIIARDTGTLTDGQEVNAPR